jgi:hypothetical protein
MIVLWTAFILIINKLNQCIQDQISVIMIKKSIFIEIRSIDILSSLRTFVAPNKSLSLVTKKERAKMKI